MIVNYAVDIFYALVALIIVILFAYRGFFASVFHFGRYIASAIVAYSFGPALSRFLYEKWVFPGIAAPVAEKVENFLNNTMGSVDIEGLVETLPPLVKKFADVDALCAKYGAAVDSFHEVAEEFSSTVAAPLASLISNAIAYVVIFFAAVLLLKLLVFLLDKFFDSIPLLKAINHILGMLLGVLAAFLALAGITWLIGVLISLLGDHEWLRLFAEQSKLFGYFQELSFFNLFH